MPKQKISRAFATATDIGGIFVSLAYVLYVSMLLFMRIGFAALNYIMLGTSLLYIAFYVFKIFYVNKLNLNRKKLKKTTRFIFRYSRHGIKLIHSLIVILSLVNIRADGSENTRLAAIIGFILVVVLLVLSIVWDVVVFFIKRKLKRMMEHWNSLDANARQDKIDYIIGHFIQSLDNMESLDDYVEIGLKTKKLVKKRFTQHVLNGSGEHQEEYEEEIEDETEEQPDEN